MTMRNAMTATTIALVCVAGVTGCSTTKKAEAGQDDEFAWQYLFEDTAAATGARDGRTNGTGASVLVTVGETTGGVMDLERATRLKVDDVVIVSLLGLREERQIENKVNARGMISMPYLKDIRAVGLTSAELEDVIYKAYVEGEIFKEITVKVMIPSQTFIYIQGEIKGPGRLQMTPGMTVMQAIAAAGGFTDWARKSRCELTRQGQTHTINLNEIERDPSKDVMLEADDRLVIGRSII